MLRETEAISAAMRQTTSESPGTQSGSRQNATKNSEDARLLRTSPMALGNR